MLNRGFISCRMRGRDGARPVSTGRQLRAKTLSAVTTLTAVDEYTVNKKAAETKSRKRNKFMASDLGIQPLFSEKGNFTA